MSDSLPSASTHQDTEDPLPTNPEDRKAAAALSSLNTNEISSPKPPNADQEALGKAMSRLEITTGQGIGKQTEVPTVARKKGVNVKVSGEDVALLVDQLDLSKVKAMELLKGHDGDVGRALKAFIMV